jgi:hypothetical protein
MTEVYSAAVKEGEEQEGECQTMGLCPRYTSLASMDLPSQC